MPELCIPNSSGVIAIVTSANIFPLSFGFAKRLTCALIQSSQPPLEGRCDYPSCADKQTGFFNCQLLASSEKLDNDTAPGHP